MFLFLRNSSWGIFSATLSPQGQTVSLTLGTASATITATYPGVHKLAANPHSGFFDGIDVVQSPTPLLAPLFVQLVITVPSSDSTLVLMTVRNLTLIANGESLQINPSFTHNQKSVTCGEHCLNCTSSTECTKCEEGFQFLPSGCMALTKSESLSGLGSTTLSIVGSDSDHSNPGIASESSPSSSSIVVVIEFDEEQNIGQLELEIEQLIKRDVQITEISKGKFEVTITDRQSLELANELINIWENCKSQP